MARSAGRLLVCREQRVLDCGDQRPLFDSLVALELANGVDDLLAHIYLSSIKLPRTIASYGISYVWPSTPSFKASAPASCSSPLNFDRPATGSRVRTAT